MIAVMRYSEKINGSDICTVLQRAIVVNAGAEYLQIVT